MAGVSGAAVDTVARRRNLQSGIGETGGYRVVRLAYRDRGGGVGVGGGGRSQPS